MLDYTTTCTTHYCTTLPELATLVFVASGVILCLSSPPSPHLSLGHLLTYLTKLPLLGAASGGKLAYLSALLEATVVGHLEEVSDTCMQCGRV